MNPVLILAFIPSTLILESTSSAASSLCLSNHPYSLVTQCPLSLLCCFGHLTATTLGVPLSGQFYLLRYLLLSLRWNPSFSKSLSQYTSLALSSSNDFVSPHLLGVATELTAQSAFTTKTTTVCQKASSCHTYHMERNHFSSMI